MSHVVPVIAPSLEHIYLFSKTKFDSTFKIPHRFAAHIVHEKQTVFDLIYGMSIEDFWFRDILQLCQAPRLAIGGKWEKFTSRANSFGMGTAPQLMPEFMIACIITFIHTTCITRVRIER